MLVLFSFSFQQISTLSLSSIQSLNHLSYEIVSALFKIVFISKKNFSSIHIDSLRVKFQWWLCARGSSRSVPVYFQALDMCMRAGNHWSPSYIQSLREWSTTSLRGLWTVDRKSLTILTLAPRCHHRCVIVLIVIVVECRVPCLTLTIVSYGTRHYHGAELHITSATFPTLRPRRHRSLSRITMS